VQILGSDASAWLLIATTGARLFLAKKISPIPAKGISDGITTRERLPHLSPGFHFAMKRLQNHQCVSLPFRGNFRTNARYPLLPPFSSQTNSPRGGIRQ